MSTINFSKFHGFGNDYVVMLADDLAPVTDLHAFTERFCNRHTGVGSDGIAVLARLEDDDAADFSCRIINPDGSEAGFSGNGTRCAVAFAYHNHLWSSEVLRLRTRSGVKRYHLTETIARGHYWFDAEIGAPKFSGGDIPFAGAPSDSPVIDQPVSLGGDQFFVSCVNVGNPVACVFVSDFDFDWRAAGRGLEKHTVFPERANIVFVHVLSRDEIELRIWERGAGETAASGTCSSGAAVLSAFRGLTGREVAVRTPGGVTRVLWREDDEMMILGRADFIFRGEIDPAEILGF